MRVPPAAVTFRELDAVCRHYFGDPRQSSGSHRVYATPWAGDPRVNIQNQRGQAKAYQVRQVVAAIDRLTADTSADETGEADG
jgi:hypothetical protein